MSNDGDVLRVRVMDWITDSPAEQQATIELFNSISTTRHLEIRLTGWTIHQNSRIHVGINTVPVILGTMISNPVIEQLTIDLECLSRNSTLRTFCGMVTTESKHQSLKTLTITCSGEEDLSRPSLKELGQSFRNLRSVTTLKFSAMDPHHLASILFHMQSDQCCIERCLSCPCLSSPKNQQHPCPRIIPQRNCDAYEAVRNHEDESNRGSTEGYPQNLEIHRVTLSHQTIANLVNLLSSNNNQLPIAQLAFKDCVVSTADVLFLAHLLKGRSMLSEIALERLRIRAFHGAPDWWIAPCQNSIPTATTHVMARLHTLRLIDCKGSRADLETITDAVVQNQGLRTLQLQYSTPDTSSMTIHTLHSLYLSTVIHNRISHLQQLEVSAGPNAQSFRLHQLAALLGHRLCRLEKLTLDLGSGPYHLHILANKLTDNNSRLRYLSLSGDDVLNVSTLDCFVSALKGVPHLKTLELDFPGIGESDEDVLRVFEGNTTLEDVRVEGRDNEIASDSRRRLCFFGLRNRLNNLLLSRPAGTSGTWQELLFMLLEWLDQTSRLDHQGKDLLFTSGLWFALMERPLMVSELTPLEDAHCSS